MVSRIFHHARGLSGGFDPTAQASPAGAVSQALCLPGKRRVHRLPGGAAAAAGTHTHTQTSPAAAAGAAAQRETEKQLEKTGRVREVRREIARIKTILGQKSAAAK